MVPQKYYYYLSVLPFFEKLPHKAKEAFCVVFGFGIRNKKDVYYLTSCYCNVMKKKINEGSSFRKKEICLIRDDKTMSLGTSYDKHHWPPKSRGGTEVVLLPDIFHACWHLLFFNLNGEEEFRFFIEKLFSYENVNDFIALYKIVNYARKRARVFS